MPRRKKTADETPSLYDITAKLRSGACVPAIREAVKSWKTGGCRGITDTTRTLLNYWFIADHKTRTGRPFKYYDFQREAIETLIYVWEAEKVRTRKDLLERYAQNIKELHLPPEDTGAMPNHDSSREAGIRYARAHDTANCLFRNILRASYFRSIFYADLDESKLHKLLHPEILAESVRIFFYHGYLTPGVVEQTPTSPARVL